MLTIDGRNRSCRLRKPTYGPCVVLLAALLSTIVVVPLPASADTYTCQSLDVPGATGTTLWHMNNQNEIAASSSVGAFIYESTTGQWIPLPPPPASSGYSAADLVALAINSHETVVGSATSATGQLQAFILGSLTDPSSYQFFTYQDLANPSDTNSEFRGINDAGLVNGWMSDPTGNADSIGIIYNSTASAISIFPPGVTTFVPKNTSNTRAYFVVAGGINNNNQFAEWAMFFTTSNESDGIVYDPGTLTTYRLIGNPTLAYALRGLNDLDPNSAANCGGSSSCIRAVGLAYTPHVGMAYPIYVDFDPAASNFQPPQAVSCGSAFNGAQSIIFEGIDNKDVAAGGWADASGVSHGLIAYPNVAQPTAIVNGSFTFSITVAASVTQFLDPPVAVGYSYASRFGGPRFGSVTFPVGVGNNHFILLVRDAAYTINGGQRFDFTHHGYSSGVDHFEVVGISPSAALDPTNTTAFVTGVTFLSGGTFTGAMEPLTAAKEILQLGNAAQEYSDRLEDRAEQIFGNYNAGNVTRACADTSSFISYIGVLVRSHRLDALRAAYLSARAAGVKNAMSCQ